MEVGRSLTRVDAFDKVTGRAKYTDDLHGEAKMCIRDSIGIGFKILGEHLG